MVTEWIVTEVDGQIASVSADYGHFAQIAAKIAQMPPRNVGAVSTRKITTEELVGLAGQVRWEDFRLSGTTFQISVSKKLFELQPRLYSYTDFAKSARRPKNPPSSRAVTCTSWTRSTWASTPTAPKPSGNSSKST